MSDTVSILMATYNGEKYLSVQIESIIHQTYDDWKLYISDDKSTDKTKCIIDEYTSKYPDKVILLDYKEKKGGAAENFAYLISNVPESQYYMFADQDDKWDINKIEKSLSEIKKMQSENKKNNLVFCDSRIVDENLNIKNNSFIKNSHLRYGEKNDVNILLANFAAGASMILDNNLFSIIKPLPKEAHIHDWWIALYACYFGNISLIPETLYSYRQHDNNAIGTGVDNGIKSKMNYLVKNKFLRTLKQVLKNMKTMQQKQYLMIDKFFELNKSQFSKSQLELISNYLNMNEESIKFVKIYKLFKNRFYCNTIIDTILYIIEI